MTRTTTISVMTALLLLASGPAMADDQVQQRPGGAQLRAGDGGGLIGNLPTTSDQAAPIDQAAPPVLQDENDIPPALEIDAPDQAEPIDTAVAPAQQLPGDGVAQQGPAAEKKPGFFKRTWGKIKAFFSKTKDKVAGLFKRNKNRDQAAALPAPGAEQQLPVDQQLGAEQELGAQK